jgi:replicative DNA helicase
MNIPSNWQPSLLSEEPERVALGSALLEDYYATLVVERLQTEDIYSDPLREVFETIKGLIHAGAPSDLIAVINRMQQEKTIERAGGITALSGLVEVAAPSVQYLEYYLGLVKRESNRRRLHGAANKVVLDMESGTDPVDGLKTFQQSLIEINAAKGREPESLAVVSDRVTQETIMRRETGVTGLPVDQMDQEIMPLRPGNVYVLAGGPGSGKSALGDQICDACAVHAGARTLIFPLEMSREQRAQRFVSRRKKIPLRRLITGQLSEMEIIDINDANRAFESLPILLDDTPGMTIEDIRIRCMKEKLARGLDLVFVDYLQLIDPLKPGRSRQEEVAEASKGLLSIARELAIPVLAAAQIGRGPEQERRAPRLSDLRESGRIEQDAHTVMMLQRVKDPDTGAGDPADQGPHPQAERL